MSAAGVDPWRERWVFTRPASLEMRARQDVIVAALATATEPKTDHALGLMLGIDRTTLQKDLRDLCAAGRVTRSANPAKRSQRHCAFVWSVEKALTP